jgi:hypothetical protein
LIDDLSFEGFPARAKYLVINLKPLQMSEYGTLTYGASWIGNKKLVGYAKIYPVVVSNEAYGSDFMTIYKLP